ncbi:MAG: hypothetical protein WCU80_01845 [Paludibacteraceae bacterium]|nr:hypothetical protein [Prevotellaceae bacterium]
MKRLILSFLLLALPLSVFYGQSESEKRRAKKLASDAISLIRVGEHEQSRKMLEMSCKLDPKNFLYPYEIGYVYTLKNDYLKAASFFEKAVIREGATDQCFQMLGNAYFLGGKKAQAEDAYFRGLKMFPNSGRLYLGLGGVNQDDWVRALDFYEQGVKVDPAYALNYYWLAKIFCNSTEKIWGLLYGEMFMNLDKNSKQSDEISKLLYDTYRSGIIVGKDTVVVDFCRNSLTYPNENKKEILPLSMVYEPCMARAVRLGSKMDLASLNETRGVFIRCYYQENYQISHPCILFDWHKSLMDNGYFECYNYWLLRKGDSADFAIWYAVHEERYGQFLKWLSENSLQVGPAHRFHRFDY